MIPELVNHLWHLQAGQDSGDVDGMGVGVLLNFTTQCRVSHTGKTKVPDLEVAGGVEEDVGGLEVPVENIGIVDVFSLPQLIELIPPSSGQVGHPHRGGLVDDPQLY